MVHLFLSGCQGAPVFDGALEQAPLRKLRSGAGVGMPTKAASDRVAARGGEVDLVAELPGGP